MSSVLKDAYELYKDSTNDEEKLAFSHSVFWYLISLYRKLREMKQYIEDGDLDEIVEQIDILIGLLGDPPNMKDSKDLVLNGIRAYVKKMEKEYENEENEEN